MFFEAKLLDIAQTDQGAMAILTPIGHNIAVPIFIGQMEAQSILIGMGNIPLPRPNTHDLMLDTLTQTGNSVERVEITEINDGILYSKIYLNNVLGIIEFDSRPSDSLAIAVRTNCPVFIDDSVILAEGVSLALIRENSEKINSDHTQNFKGFEKQQDDNFL